MEGNIKVSYIIMCDNDTSKEINLSQLLDNEKVEKAIKSEFTKGLRNIVLSISEDTKIELKTKKEIYSFVVEKNDFADLLGLAEDDAKKHKRVKKECQGVELVNIETID
jgi:hypothetical protein